MYLVDGRLKKVEHTLNAIYDAVHGHTRVVKTEDAMLVLMYDNESYCVSSYYDCPIEHKEFDSIEEAYSHFRFLVEAYYHLSLPSL